MQDLSLIDKHIKNIKTLSLMLEIAFIFILLGTTPILGIFHFSISEFAIYSLILLFMYVPLIFVNKFLYVTKKNMENNILKEESLRKQRERIFTENDRTFNSYNEYKEKFNSQQKSEFYVNKNINNIIYEKELKILQMELKDLKLYTKKDLKAAYRKAAKENHPDFGKNEIDIKDRTERMILINLAYNALLSKIK